MYNNKKSLKYFIFQGIIYKVNIVLDYYIKFLSSCIQTLLSASEFNRISHGTQFHGSRAIPPVGSSTLPWRTMLFYWQRKYTTTADRLQEGWSNVTKKLLRLADRVGYGIITLLSSPIPTRGEVKYIWKWLLLFCFPSQRV